MVAGLAAYLGRHPGIYAGLLTALGATGRMAEVLHTKDTWIARPLRDLLAEGRVAGVIHAEDIADTADTANAILGGILLAVLGRSMSQADPADRNFTNNLPTNLYEAFSPAEPSLGVGVRVGGRSNWWISAASSCRPRASTGSAAVFSTDRSGFLPATCRKTITGVVA